MTQTPCIIFLGKWFHNPGVPNGTCEDWEKTFLFGWGVSRCCPKLDDIVEGKMCHDEDTVEGKRQELFFPGEFFKTNSCTNLEEHFQGIVDAIPKVPRNIINQHTRIPRNLRSSRIQRLTSDFKLFILWHFYRSRAKRLRSWGPKRFKSCWLVQDLMNLCVDVGNSEQCIKQRNPCFLYFAINVRLNPFWKPKSRCSPKRAGMFSENESADSLLSAVVTQIPS